jgi:transaldolase/glucose-6-phosphate isomerase
MNSNDLAKRIWQKDASLWKSDEDSAKIIKNSLGWLTVADEMLGVVDELVAFAESVRERGFQHVMVCGMGGSSLCPGSAGENVWEQPGFPELLVLDSTDPDVIAASCERIDIERCLFVIASKSGSTTEPNVFYKFWYEEVSKRRDNPGDNFVAITDPGSQLVETAKELKFLSHVSQPTRHRRTLLSAFILRHGSGSFDGTRRSRSSRRARSTGCKVDQRMPRSVGNDDR